MDTGKVIHAVSMDAEAIAVTEKNCKEYGHSYCTQ